MKEYRVKPLTSSEPIKVEVPGSKSITNRALMLAALGNQTCELRGVLFSDDSRAFLSCLQELGFEVVIEELLRIPFTGRADHENIGQITFFANAFRSKEDLIRTLYHEIQHVKQYRKYGVEFVLNNNTQFEDEAYALEDNFVKLLKERGIL